MVVEQLCASQDLSEENEDIAKRCPGFCSSVAFRLTFFKKSFKTRRGLSSATDEDFLGYAIVKVDDIPGKGESSRLYESVVHPSRHPNNFIHGAQTWNCRAGDRGFSVQGFLYAQQNNITNVCAHVALRTAAARFHPHGDMSYREMNQIAGIDHEKRKVGEGKGLSLQQMLDVLEAAGARTVVADYTLPGGRHAGVPFQKYLYGSVESGYPAIVLFAASRPDAYHAIPVFGHTFNEDTWVPSAALSYFSVGPQTSYTPSEAWVSMYIAHDDNWGSNYCIPRGYLHVQRLCDRISPGPVPCPLDQERVACVIGTLPQAVLLDPLRAEVIGADYLFRAIRPQMPRHVGIWAERLRWYADQKLLVLRPVLLDQGEYTRHLRRVRDWDGSAIDEGWIAVLEEAFPERLWMVELSVPRLFSANRRKVGEVVLRAGFAPGTKRDLRSFVIARLPGCFALPVGGGGADPQYRFFPSGADGHVELFGCEEREE